MKCPLCGAWSTVHETREMHGVPRRRRECANHHKFWTLEIVEGTTAQAKKALRNAEMLQAYSELRNASAVARRFGVTEGTVRNALGRVKRLGASENKPRKTK